MEAAFLVCTTGTPFVPLPLFKVTVPVGGRVSLHHIAESTSVPKNDKYPQIVADEPVIAEPFPGTWREERLSVLFGVFNHIPPIKYQQTMPTPKQTHVQPAGVGETQNEDQVCVHSAPTPLSFRTVARGASP